MSISFRIARDPIEGPMHDGKTLPLAEVNRLFLKQSPDEAVKHPAFATIKEDESFRPGALKIYFYCEGMLFTDRLWITTVAPEEAAEFCALHGLKVERAGEEK